MAIFTKVVLLSKRSDHEQVRIDLREWLVVSSFASVTQMKIWIGIISCACTRILCMHKNLVHFWQGFISFSWYVLVRVFHIFLGTSFPLIHNTQYIFLYCIAYWIAYCIVLPTVLPMYCIAYWMLHYVIYIYYVRYKIN